MYICGLIPRYFAELAEAVPIDLLHDIKITQKSLFWFEKVMYAILFRTSLHIENHLWLIVFYIQVIIWSMCASRKYWQWGSRVYLSKPYKIINIL